jgi:CDP-diacylglycerol--serine O-phosphatidyltransferase
MFRPTKVRIKALPINSLAPNILTTLALCAGLTSIRFSLLGRWHLAVAAIVFAAICDSLDGRLARLLKGVTRFGAELDSLSDFISFGVAPVILIYLWSLQDLKTLGWIVVLAFSVCCALRLARFNTAADDPSRPAWSGDFFTGVPSPAAAGLAILPLLFFLETEMNWLRSAFLNAPWTLAVALAMVSRVPTFSGKRLRVPRDWVMPMLLLTGLFTALLIIEPWITLICVGMVYLASVPFSMRAHARQLARVAPSDADAPVAAHAVSDDEAHDDDATDEHRLH